MNHHPRLWTAGVLRRDSFGALMFWVNERRASSKVVFFLFELANIQGTPGALGCAFYNFLKMTEDPLEH